MNDSLIAEQVQERTLEAVVAVIRKYFKEDERSLDLADWLESEDGRKTVEEEM